MSYNEVYGAITGFVVNIIFWFVMSCVMGGWFWAFGLMLMIINVFMIVVLVGAPDDGHDTVKFKSQKLMSIMMWIFNPIVSVLIQFKRLLIG
jgi:hypothetical protein